ncbi:MAG: MOP flippase family protein [Bacteroidales bacterium]|nr:MOP flippase family protein [Bacteroidales bacterium]
MDLRKSAVSGLKWNTVSTVVCLLIQMLRLAILSRLLAKSDFGLVATAMMVISFTDIFSQLGLSTGVIHKQDITDDQYSSLYWMNLFMSIVVFMIVCALSPALASFFREESLSKIIPLLGLQVILTAFGKIFQTIKQKYLEFDFISKVRMFSTFVGFLFTVFLAYKDFGVYSLVYGQLLQIFVNQAFFVVAGFRTVRVRLHFSFAEVKDFLRIGVYQLGSQTLDFLANRIDIFLIGRFFGMDDLGVYNLAKDLINKPYQSINSLVSNVASSYFAVIQDQVEKVVGNFKKIVSMVSKITIPLYLAMFAFSDSIVTIMYPKFPEVAILLRIMALIGIMNSVNSQSGSLQVAYGRTDIGFRWTVIRVVTTTLVIIAASSFSIFTVAYSQLALSLVLFYCYWLITIRPIIPLKFNEYVKPMMGPFLVVASIALAVVAIHCAFGTNLLMDAILACLAGAAVLFYYARFHSEELAEIIKMFRK